jgi:hypothetical protein
MMNAEEVARRHSQRPGCALISYGEVGLPYYRLRLRAQVLEHKPIGPFAEFTLRAANFGIDNPDAIGSFLGLDDRVLETTVVGLMRSDDLYLTPRNDATHTSLALTPKGIRTLENATSVVPEEMEVEVDYDGLLRRPAMILDRWLSPVELKEIGAREIPPARVRPPELVDIDLAAVDSIIRQVGNSRRARRDLLALKAMRRRRIYQIAVALVFRPDDGGEVQIAFAIDGQLSPEHEDAFARTSGKKKIAGRPMELPGSDLVEVLGAELIKEADRSTKAKPHPSVGSDGQSGSVDPIVQEERADSPTVLPLETYDHPRYLREALENARDRVLIVSPWVKTSVVDKRFLQALEARLAHGVDVFIGWGIGGLEEPDQDADAAVVTAFGRLARAYPGKLNAKRLGGTHAKVLICDRRFVIATSFNWLSFRGDPNRTFRDERGYFVAIPEETDKQFDAWARRFDSRQSP